MTTLRISALTLLALLSSAMAFAQIQPDLKNELQQIHDFGQKLSKAQRSHLSTGGANVLQVADQFTALTGVNTLTFTPAAQVALAQATAQAQAEGQLIPAGGPVRLNARAFDYVLSRLAGFTQSETSSAWCGNTIVAGFNDSGALLRSLADGHGGASFNGVSVSHNGGRSFVELPFLNPGGDPANFLGGDPVVACSSPSTFYYASLFEKSGPSGQPGNRKALTGISVNLSLDGGNHWLPPVSAVTKSINHFLDKEWMAVDPTNPRRLFLTYTDFDLSLSSCDSARIAIELVHSENAGASWSRPVVLDQICGFSFDAVQGSQVVVGSNSEVYASWAEEDPFGVEVRFASSLDHGVTFTPPLAIASADAAGLPGFAALQGLFRSNGFPALAVDTSNSARRGTLYLAWTDGAGLEIDDVATFTGTYNFGDVLFASSTDGGASWSPPTKVHPTGPDSPGRDQFMPVIAVDPAGRVAVCYSDRRNDAQNNLVDHFCSISDDGGSTFTEARQTPNSWVPSHSNDAFINSLYMGDYDAVSADATGSQAGFFSTFQVEINSNPDVFGTRH